MIVNITNAYPDRQIYTMVQENVIDSNELKAREFIGFVINRKCLNDNNNNSNNKKKR